MPTHPRQLVARKIGSKVVRPPAPHVRPATGSLPPLRQPAPPRTPAALPVDPTYDQTEIAARRQRDDTLAGLGYEQGGDLAAFGYNATFSPTGAVQSLTFDPNNPYSRASLLLKNYQNQKRGTLNSLASRGQLYSGALQNAQTFNDRNYSINEDALRKSLQSALANIIGRRTAAQDTYGSTVAQAASDRANRAVQTDTGDTGIRPPRVRRRRRRR